MPDTPTSGAETPPPIAQVSAREADHVTNLLALAFYDDPTWSWAVPDPAHRLEQQRRWWGLYMSS
ncbi:hypothetical protein ABTD73_19150, partial [Acinetobacter baumannii]